MRRRARRSAAGGPACQEPREGRQPISSSGAWPPPPCQNTLICTQVKARPAHHSSAHSRQGGCGECLVVVFGCSPCVTPAPFRDPDGQWRYLAVFGSLSPRAVPLLLKPRPVLQAPGWRRRGHGGRDHDHGPWLPVQPRAAPAGPARSQGAAGRPGSSRRARQVQAGSAAAPEVCSFPLARSALECQHHPIRRRTMSSPRTIHNKPHPLWAMPTDTATAIPITASTAIGAGAPRPDGRSAPASGGRNGHRGQRSGEGAGKISQEILQLTPGPSRKGPPRSVFELLGRQPARLEMLTQVGQDRIAVGIGSPHLSGRKVPQHGVHQAAALHLVPLYLRPS